VYFVFYAASDLVAYLVECAAALGRRVAKMCRNDCTYAAAVTTAAVTTAAAAIPHSLMHHLSAQVVCEPAESAYAYSIDLRLLPGNSNSDGSGGVNLSSSLASGAIGAAAAPAVVASGDIVRVMKDPGGALRVQVTPAVDRTTPPSIERKAESGEQQQLRKQSNNNNKGQQCMKLGSSSPKYHSINILNNNNNNSPPAITKMQ
jgi:hypothetical protein